mgnify:CR=1 FL=1
MFEVKNFDNWIEDKESGRFGSGASEKIWLINPETNEKALFKFPKVKDKEKGIITGEYWAEKLATEIGKLIDVECARVDIGTYKGRIGSMSYNIIKIGDEFIEGINYIQTKYPYYQKEQLFDEYSGEKYTVQMIKNSLSEDMSLLEDIFNMIIFDALIGNSDRHHSNWGILFEYNHNSLSPNYKLAPLYDNGSSLCSYINEDDIENIFTDKLRFESVINTKSKSTIGWNETRPIRHFELIQLIRENYYNETVDIIKRIKQKINEGNIKEILGKFDNTIISPNMKKLIEIFILERKSRIINIYNLERGE